MLWGYAYLLCISIYTIIKKVTMYKEIPPILPVQTEDLKCLQDTHSVALSLTAGYWFNICFPWFPQHYFNLRKTCLLKNSLKFCCILTTVSFLHEFSKPGAFFFQGKSENLSDSVTNIVSNAHWHLEIHRPCFSHRTIGIRQHACEHWSPLRVLLSAEEKYHLSHVSEISEIAFQ